MFCAAKTVALRPQDIPALQAFLMAGFSQPEGTDPFAADVLHWKYFDPCGFDQQPRSLLAFEGDTIVGHIGICPRRFTATNLDLDVGTLHFIDWLASPEHPSVGLGLMMKGFRSAPTQYALGGSSDGAQMAQQIGYQTILKVPLFHKVLRPDYRLRSRRHGLIEGGLRAAKDLGRALQQLRPPPRTRVTLAPVRRFGDEVEAIIERCEMDQCMTSRTPALLNHYLRHPRGVFQGWLMRAQGRVIGFALTSLLTREGNREGRIVECFIDQPREDLWHGAVAALTNALKHRAADVALGYASTPWARRGFQATGFAHIDDTSFQLRDRKAPLPHDAVFHLTPLEADNGYIV